MRWITTSWLEPGVKAEAMNPRARRNLILALVHAALALAILAGFVYVQSHR